MCVDGSFLDDGAGLFSGLSGQEEQVWLLSHAQEVADILSLWFAGGSPVSPPSWSFGIPTCGVGRGCLWAVASTHHLTSWFYPQNEQAPSNASKGIKSIFLPHV